LKSTGYDPISTLERSKLANGLLLLLRGSPALYYGDESGMAGAGGDKLARQDMFATDVEIWKNELRIGGLPIANRSSFDVSNPLRDQITQLQQLIKANPALRNGMQQTRYAKGGVFVISRYSKGQEYLVAFNSSDVTETVSVVPGNESTEWPLIHGSGSVKSESGSVAITLPARNFIVAKASTLAIPKTNLTIQLLGAKDGDYTPNWLELSATVPGNDFVDVTFATREEGKSWKVVGTSDHRTFTVEKQTGDLFRVYIRPEDYKKSKTIEVLAIAKNSKGETAVSKIRKIEIS
jgi:hypothetical protein